MCMKKKLLSIIKVYKLICTSSLRSEANSFISSFDKLLIGCRDLDFIIIL